MALKPVTQLFVNDEGSIWELIVRSISGQTEVHRVTDNHPYWLSSEGWIKVRDLEPGMVLETRDEGVVTLIALYDTGRVERTFNLEIADFHTYFVGRNQVLVHNCNKLKGGAYREVKGQKGMHAHHIPADAASPLSTNEGPTISMDAADHRNTASYGRSKLAQQYREKQKNLIEQGQFREAQQMDIADSRSKFGSKYDTHIQQMDNYTDKLGLQ